MLAALALLAATAGPPNLLLVTIDTLRADRVGAYGYAAAQTPTLDRLAREGVLVEDAVVQVPQTRPSHATILTGRQPYEHGIRDNYSSPLDPKIPALATILRRQGYDTAAFIGAYPVSRASGLDQGFQTFDDPFGGGERSTTSDPRLERPASQVADAALKWLAAGPRGRPFFAWLHFFDPHAPYDAPPPEGPRFAKSPYDGEVAFSDAQLGRILDWLDRSGPRNDTLVVVTSDHGEGLGDHGEDEHLLFVYDSTLRVPLLLRWPGKLPAGARIRGQFRSVDLVATVLELLGAPASATSGASRAAALRSGGRIPDNESYAESLYGSLHFGWAPMRCLRAEGWKYIDAPRPELYRLSEDPGERKNLAAERSQVAGAMRSRLASYDTAGGPRPASAAATVDAGAAERLAALGYIGGGFFEGKPSGADPKDKIGDFQAYRRDVVKALRFFRERDFDGAIALLRRLSQSSSNGGGQVLERRSFNVEYYLGRCLVEKRRFSEAIPHLESAVVLAPTSAPAYVFLAQAYGGARRLNDASSVIERGLARAPDNPELLQAEGSLLLRQGNLAGARAALEKARSVDGENALVRVDLCAVYRNLGELERAAAESDAAVRLDPKSPEARVEKGLVLGARGREADAAAALREALALAPDQPDALFYLASIELRGGRSAQALLLLERLVARAPEYPQARASLALAREGLAPLPDGSARLRILTSRDRQRAEDAARRAAAGEDFAALARRLSEDPSGPRGGDLGVVRLADLTAPLRTAAAALAPGGVSPVIETPQGFVVLKREH